MRGNFSPLQFLYSSSFSVLVFLFLSSISTLFRWRVIRLTWLSWKKSPLALLCSRIQQVIRRRSYCGSSHEKERERVGEIKQRRKEGVITLSCAQEERMRGDALEHLLLYEYYFLSSFSRSVFARLSHNTYSRIIIWLIVGATHTIHCTQHISFDSFSPSEFCVYVCMCVCVSTTRMCVLLPSSSSTERLTEYLCRHSFAPSFICADSSFCFSCFLLSHTYTHRTTGRAINAAWRGRKIVVHQQQQQQQKKLTSFGLTSHSLSLFLLLPYFYAKSLRVSVCSFLCWCFYLFSNFSLSRFSCVSLWSSCRSFASCLILSLHSRRGKSLRQKLRQKSIYSICMVCVPLFSRLCTRTAVCCCVYVYVFCFPFALASHRFPELRTCIHTHTHT